MVRLPVGAPSDKFFDMMIGHEKIAVVVFFRKIDGVFKNGQQDVPRQYMKMTKDDLTGHGYHLHHDVIDRPGNKCYFNWYLKRFDLGIELKIGNYGIDYSISVWGSLVGYFVWSKKERIKLQKIIQ